MKAYILLTKPGILIGNSITAAAGFLLASKWDVNGLLLITTLFGLCLIMASGCVFNNYIDRKADRKMTRTKHRALATGQIPSKHALFFACILGLSGFFLLLFYTNLLATVIASIGFIIYVLVYTFSKYRSRYGTLIGSIAGAVPPVVGYTAVSGHLDLASFLLFMIVALWQMPHFFAIALYRSEDYKAADIPVLPAIKGTITTKIHMLLYIIAFVITSLMLTFFHYTGYIYLIAASGLGLVWIWKCIKGFQSADDHLWAKHMFLLSLKVITILCIMISIDLK